MKAKTQIRLTPVSRICIAQKCAHSAESHSIEIALLADHRPALSSQPRNDREPGMRRRRRANTAIPTASPTLPNSTAR
jgi:hypothetical protein